MLIKWTSKLQLDILFNWNINLIKLPYKSEFNKTKQKNKNWSMNNNLSTAVTMFVYITYVKTHGNIVLWYYDDTWGKVLVMETQC